MRLFLVLINCSVEAASSRVQIDYECAGGRQPTLRVMSFHVLLSALVLVQLSSSAFSILLLSRHEHTVSERLVQDISSSLPNIVIDEYNMEDLERRPEAAQAITPVMQETQKRLFVNHHRPCLSQESNVETKKLFRGAYSTKSIFLPQQFAKISCRPNSTNPSLQRSQNGQGMHPINPEPRCLWGMMDCVQVTTTLYFVVYDPFHDDKCLRMKVLKINGVPVECSCLWPRGAGGPP